MKLHAVFYLLENHTEWHFYGAFTTSEMANGISKNKPEMIKDGIGDTVVTLVCLAQRCGLEFEECVQTAYDEIKDRKGKMIDGVFVKEADLEDQK